MDTTLKELRHAVRALLKRPGFTAVAALSLALGIGVNTTVFTLVKALFLKPLPVEEPARLMAVLTADEQNPRPFMAISYPNAMDLAAQQDSLAGLTVSVFSGFEIEIDDKDERELGQMVGGEYFDVLGVEAALGRTLEANDAPAPEEGEPVMVLSHGFWERHLGSDPQVLGRVVKVNRMPFTVVGVMPRGFTGNQQRVEPQFFVPVTLLQRLIPSFDPDGEAFTSRRGLFFSAHARLQPGVSREQAQANLDVIGRRLEEQYPQANAGRSFQLMPLAEANLDPDPAGRARTRMAMSLLMGLVGLVLLIACANVANLLLVHSAARSREVAIRISMGSTRVQLARRFLLESLVLALAGGALSLAVAHLGRKLLLASLPARGFVIGYDFSLDGRVLAFTFAVTLLTALAFGLIPSWKAARVDVVGELKETPTLGGAGRRFSGRNLLVAGQVALSLVALVATGLFIRSLDALRQADPGFDTGNIAVAAGIDFAGAGYDQPRSEVFFRELEERASNLPGAQGAVVAEMLPFIGGGFGRTVFLEGQEQGSGEGGRMIFVGATNPGYFDTLGLPLVKGRTFTDADREDTQKVVVVNEAMAKLFWGDEEPIGKRFHFHSLEDYRYVVGVVADNKFFQLDEEPRAVAWYPLAQMYTPTVHLVVRAGGDPTTILAGMRELLRELDPNLSSRETVSLPVRVERSLFLPRTISRLLAVFGGLALTLALVGLFGVVSYSVAQRHREIGIRMAIGARRRDVLGLVFSQGLVIVASGVAVGLLAAWAGGRLVESYLYAISPTDLVTLAVTPLLLVAAAGAAILLPARRAASVDPVTALKYE